MTRSYPLPAIPCSRAKLMALLVDFAYHMGRSADTITAPRSWWERFLAPFVLAEPWRDDAPGPPLPLGPEWEGGLGLRRVITFRFAADDDPHIVLGVADPPDPDPPDGADPMTVTTTTVSMTTADGRVFRKWQDADGSGTYHYEVDGQSVSKDEFDAAMGRGFFAEPPPSLPPGSPEPPPSDTPAEPTP